MPFVQPLLVGEVNPYGADPVFALYPLPEHATGGRLAAILDMSRSTYLRAFRRVNLCTGAWSGMLARLHAELICADVARDQRPLVLLGRKVMTAFGFGAAAFFSEVPAAVPLPRAILLPHPSGRNPIWNDPRAAERARALVYPLLPRRPAATEGEGDTATKGKD